MLNLTSLAIPALPVVIFSLIYYVSTLVMAYIARKKVAIPQLAQELLDKLGGKVLLEAYYKAEKDAATPSLKRDIAAAYIKAAADKAGLTITTSTINFLIEFVVNIIHNEGPVSADNLAKTFPGA